jgi:hypothetical protein
MRTWVRALAGTALTVSLGLASASTPPSAAKDDNGTPLPAILLGVGGIARLIVIGGTLRHGRRPGRRR